MLGSRMMSSTILRAALAIVLAFFAQWTLAAGCSSYAGNTSGPISSGISINEYNYSGNYLELKVIDPALKTATSNFSGWTLSLYQKSGGGSSRTDYAVSSLISSGGGCGASSTYIKAPVSGSLGNDSVVVLWSGAHNSQEVDYFRIGQSGYPSFQPSTCFAASEFSTSSSMTYHQAALTGSSARKDIARGPDGTGRWIETPYNGSDQGTSCATNDSTLTLSKAVTSASSVKVGETVSFRITLTLDSRASNQTGVAVTDLLPTGLSFLSATPSVGSYSSSTGIWTIGNLPTAGGSRSATLDISTKATQVGAIVNSVSVVSSDFPAGTIPSASATVTVNQPLTLVKSVLPASTVQGGAATFSVQVTNTGSAALPAGFTISDAVPSGLTAGTVSVTTGTYSGSTWTVPSGMPANTTYTLTMPVTAGSVGSSTNTATALAPFGGANVSASATLTVAAPPMLSFPAALSISEGDSGMTPLVVTASLSAATSVDVTFDYATQNGSAVAGTDYTAATGSVSIPAGQTSANFTLNVIGDTVTEPDRQFAVVISGVNNASLSGSATIPITIRDDDLLAEYRMDGNWADSTGNYPGQATGASLVSGAPGPAYGDATAATCGYGRFDVAGAPMPYLELTGLPALNADFTVAGWIHSTDVSKPRQRIISRDDVNDGWGLSLSDGATGALRLFNAAASFTVPSVGGSASGGNLDTDAVLAANAWYYVAASVDSVAKLATIRVYKADGTLWTSAQANFTGAWAVGSGATTIGGESSASSENAANYFKGYLDEIRIYRGALSAAKIAAILATTRSCSCTLGSFRLTQPATALACPDTRATVKIEPMCIDGTTIKDDFAGAVDIAASNGGALYSASTGGATIATVSFVAGDAFKEVYLDSSNEASICVSATSGAINSTAAACTAFHAYGFRVATPPGDFACGTGNSTALKIEAYGKTSSSAACNVITGFAGSKVLKVWFESSVDSDSGTLLSSNKPLIFGGASVSDTAIPAANNVSASFVAGAATIAIESQDVGRINWLRIRHDVSPYSGGACGSSAPLCPLEATTGAFLIYPDHFALASTSGVCASPYSSCAKFVAAGDDFSMSLAALCRGDSAATEYRNGSGPISLAATTVYPAGGESGGLKTNALSITTGGKADFVQSWAEVGAVKITAQPPKWFGRDMSAAEVELGRFIPKRFELNSTRSMAINRADLPAATVSALAAKDQYVLSITYPASPAAIFATGDSVMVMQGGPGGAPLLTKVASATTSSLTLDDKLLNDVPGGAAVFRPATHGFTYFGEPLLVIAEVNAVNAAGATTKNYAGYTVADWFGVGAGVTTGAGFGAPKVSGQAAIFDTVGAAGWQKGVGVFAIGLSQPRSATPVAPATLSVGLAPKDADGVVMDGFDLDADLSAGNERKKIAEVPLRYGRVRVSNAFGSEKRPLALPAVAQYWNGNFWDTNLLDVGGSLLASPSITITKGPSGAITYVSGSRFTTSTISPGRFRLGLSAGAPSAATLGFTVADYLQYPWSGAAMESPQAKVSFGLYSGARGMIFRREVR